MMEWQPIETARKDGTEIDIWGEDGRSPKASWGEYTDWNDWNLVVVGWRMWSERTDEYVEVRNSTHWMEIPKPPVLAKTQEPG